MINVAVALFKYCSSVKKMLPLFVMYASHRYLGLHARNVALFMKNNTPLPNIRFKPYRKLSSSDARETRQVGN